MAPPALAVLDWRVSSVVTTFLLAAKATAACARSDGVRPAHRRCKRNEFNTTETELNAIAAEAIIGFSLPSAATGIATVL